MVPEDSVNNKLNEPTAKYGKRELRFFNSFEEAKEYEYEQIRKQSYTTRILNTVGLIQRVYSDRMNHGIDDNLIIKHRQ